MKLYITRHGETEWNIEGRIQGWGNSNLTEKGIENAIKLGDRLKNVSFDYIFSSPLGRAVDTAKWIKGEKNAPIVLKESLKEMGFGVWEGMKHSQVDEMYPTERYNFKNKPHLYKNMNGESFTDILYRAKQFLSEVTGMSKCENILMVSHAVYIKAIYSVIKNYTIESFWNPPFINDTCLTILDIKDNEISIILEADTSHL